MGGLLEGETATQAIIREAKEETCTTIIPEEIDVCHIMYHFHRMPNGYSFPQMDIYFRAKKWEGTIMNGEPHRCDELKFYPLNALPENIEPFIVHALDCSKQNQFYSEFSWTS